MAARRRRSLRRSMAAAAASPPSPPKLEPSARPDHLPRPSVAISWDSRALCKRAETCELESEAFLIDPALLPTLEGLLLEIYAMLRPKPVDYEQQHIMIDVFNNIAKDIFGKTNGFPVVEAFGSFTMDLFTTKSDLDLSVNFNTDMNSEFARNDKISVIRKFAKVLHEHQSKGRCSGVLPVVSAIVPVLKVTDKGTGIECDISVENKDGMSRSMIFKLISSIDERFQILCYLMKFWAKSHDVNCPKDRTMSSMAIISLVAFHLQTRRPPILPAFSGLLKDGADFASIQRNISLFEGFGSRNKESVAELFVSLMSKLLSVEGLWEQGLCASNLEGYWISKTWDRGIGNLSVEDFLDQSQNFARSVGKVEMQKICECLRDTVSKLTDFFRGNIDAPNLKILIFGPLDQDEPVSHPSLKRVKTKRKRDSRHDPGNSQKHQKKVKYTAQPGHAANTTAASLSPPTVFVPPQVRQRRSTQLSTQSAHRSQHLITPSRFAYELPQPHLHSTPQLVGHPQGNFIHLNPAMQLQQQAPHMLAPLLAHQPVINGFHPYVFDGAQQIRHDENSMMRGLPYGINRNYRRV